MSTQLAANGCYGCWNRRDKPAKTIINVPDGYTNDGRRKTRTRVTHWKNIACGHSERASDERREGCQWRNVE